MTLRFAPVNGIWTVMIRPSVEVTLGLIITGEWHLDSNDKTERDFNVKNIIVHKLFNRPQRFANDIALLELSEDADLDDVYVGTACLPPSGKDYR